jgi:hypothetical protein
LNIPEKVDSVIGALCDKIMSSPFRAKVSGAWLDEAPATNPPQAYPYVLFSLPKTRYQYTFEDDTQEKPVVIMRVLHPDAAKAEGLGRQIKKFLRDSTLPGILDFVMQVFETDFSMRTSIIPNSDNLTVRESVTTFEVWLDRSGG